MENCEVILKDVYRHEQTEGFVRVDEYAFLSDKSSDYIALTFKNDLDTTVDSMSFTLIQEDSRGKIIARSPVTYASLNVLPHSCFSQDSMIKVPHGCVDFKVIVNEVRSGDMVYTLCGGDVVVRYVKLDPVLADTESDEVFKIPPAYKKHRFLMFAVAVFIIAALVISYIALLSSEFTKEAERREEKRRKNPNIRNSVAMCDVADIFELQNHKTIRRM